MTEHTDRRADQGQEDFELERRGYSRRQVDEFAAKTRNHTRDLENRLSHALDENERIRLELATARQAASSKPAHEEISERVGQILKLADDEAKSQRNRANDDITKLRNDAKQDTDRLRAEAKQETDKFRAEAQSQAERMLRAAQEQAENSVASARAEAEKTRNASRAEAERSISEAHKQAETAVASAKAQAKQVLDEATARATAIHDGAERRLNLLMSRHTEAIRRLTEIRDVVTTLVAGEVARGSLEDEVEKAVASAIGESKQGGRPGAPAEGRHAPAGTAGTAGSGAQSPPAPASAPSAGVAAAAAAAQQAAGRIRSAEQGPRTQPASAKPVGSEPSGLGATSGTDAQAASSARPAGGARNPNGQPADTEGHGGPGRPAGTAEGARHAASGPRPGAADDTADNVRIVPE
jgi:cell division septum initiation protein DivIVA